MRCCLRFKPDAIVVEIFEERVECHQRGITTRHQEDPKSIDSRDRRGVDDDEGNLQQQERSVSGCVGSAERAGLAV